MKNTSLVIPLLALLLLNSCGDRVASETIPVNPRCQYLSDALIANEVPHFSWEIQSSEDGCSQKAWQILVSDNFQTLEKGEGDIWNSGKREGDATFGIAMEDVKLQSFREYHWMVRIWNQNGEVTPWSTPGSFITGALHSSDWKASWIGDTAERPLDYPLLYKHIGYLSAYSSNENEEKWVEVDLGGSSIFDRVVLYPSYDNIRNIQDLYYPLSFRIETSDDQKKWQLLEERENADSPGGEAVTITVPETQGRYIRFTATKLRRYTHRVHDYNDRGDPTKMYSFSLSELEVYRGDSAISTHCQVACKDALVKLDREDGYDPDMLTDGIHGTPAYPEHRPTPPSPLLRKAVVLEKAPVKALAYVSALGLYDLSVNGSSPDTRVLAPEWTDYNQRVQYQVYDLTHLLSEGVNIIGAQLADGWYAGMLGPTRWSPYFPTRGAYGLDRRLFFQLELEFADGSRKSVVSDHTWKIYSDGPIRRTDLFLGETYDGYKEVEGWRERRFNDSLWRDVEAEELAVHLVPQVNQPIRPLEMLDALSVEEAGEGVYIFDMGQNIAGWCRINLKALTGDTIVLRHGEMLDETGQLYTENLGAAIQCDTIIPGDNGATTYEPQFTYHGFRFVEVSGLKERPDRSLLKAIVIASDLPQTGSFECSNPMLNQLYKNINRSHISNMHGVPTDCPQRDERCGWMGDVFIFAQTSMLNRDMAAFYNKWMQDVVDAQSESGTFPDIAPHPFGSEKHFTNAPGWADAAIRLPYMMYLNYGEINMMEHFFPQFEKYIQNISELNPDLIWKIGTGLNYNDWLNGNTLNAEGFPKTGAQIPPDVFSTIMFYYSANTLSQMATALQLKDKALQYGELALKIKDAFLGNFVDKMGQIEGDAQSCYAMALHYGLYTDTLEKVFENRMIEKFIPYDGRMNTGFHSTLPLMEELVQRGYQEKAYELLETKEFPSWGYSIEQGATSMWERWDGYIKGRGFQGAGMNSFNHYAFGAIGEWMFRHILGIQPDPLHPGYKHFFLKPVPGGSLTSAKGSYQTICGMIEVEWTREGDQIDYQFTVPPNTTATVILPDQGDNTTSRMEIGAGTHRIGFRLNEN